MLLPDPATKPETISGGTRETNENPVRFPWIHRREPVAIHSLYMAPSKNHEAVPLCWASQAVLWLIDGSGGESHRHISVRSRLSEVVLVRVSDGCESVNDKHFVLFNSSDVFCIVTGAAVS
jgi:hypothetical protein